MTALNAIPVVPDTILLATDLSARCDRALDRAASLALAWKAQLVVLHVREKFEPDTLDALQLPSWLRPTDPTAYVRRQLVADVNTVAEKALVLIREGNPVDEILRASEALGCKMIVIGTARNELLGRLSLGRTVDKLLRRATVPLLVVKERPRQAYRQIVVATDFSDSSRFALESAARLFPEQRLTVFHACDARSPGLLNDTASFRRNSLKNAVSECNMFLERANMPATWRSPSVVVEDGAPTYLLRDYICQKEVDLVVLGTQGRSAIHEVLFGSVAKAIMDETICDAMVIREPRTARVL